MSGGHAPGAELLEAPAGPRGAWRRARARSAPPDRDRAPNRCRDTCGPGRAAPARRSCGRRPAPCASRWARPAKARRQRSSMVSRAVLTSSFAAQNSTWASSSPAFSALRSAGKTSSPAAGSSSSEWTMLGFSRQAMTFRRSAISSANIFPGWVKSDRMPRKPGRLTASSRSFFFLSFTEHGASRSPGASASTSLAAIFQSLPSPRRSTQFGRGSPAAPSGGRPRCAPARGSRRCAPRP